MSKRRRSFDSFVVLNETAKRRNRKEIDSSGVEMEEEEERETFEQEKYGSFSVIEMP